MQSVAIIANSFIGKQVITDAQVLEEADKKGILSADDASRRGIPLVLVGNVLKDVAATYIGKKLELKVYYAEEMTEAQAKKAMLDALKDP